MNEHSRLFDEAADHVLKASSERASGLGAGPPAVERVRAGRVSGRVAEGRGAHESLARNRALVDGNKPVAWYATWVFLHMNGHPLDAEFTVDEAEEFVLDVCQGALDVPKIAAQLPRFAR